MKDMIIAIGVLYCMFQIIVIAGAIVGYTEHEDDWTPILFPSEWYRKGNLNWFGATMASIGGFIFGPVVYLCRIFSWLCHIGRK